MSTSRSVTIQFVYSTSHPPPCSRVLPRPPAKSGSPCIPIAGSTLRRCGVQFLSGKRDRASWSSVGRRNVRACRLVVWIIQREVSRNQHHRSILQPPLVSAFTATSLLHYLHAARWRVSKKDSTTAQSVLRGLPSILTELDPHRFVSSLRHSTSDWSGQQETPSCLPHGGTLLCGISWTRALQRMARGRGDILIIL
jgi:hypothetical protein